MSLHKILEIRPLRLDGDLAPILLRECVSASRLCAVNCAARWWSEWSHWSVCVFRGEMVRCMHGAYAYATRMGFSEKILITPRNSKILKTKLNCANVMC